MMMEKMNKLILMTLSTILISCGSYPHNLLHKHKKYQIHEHKYNLGSPSYLKYSNNIRRYNL